MAMRTLRAKGEAGEERRIIMDEFFSLRGGQTRRHR